MSRVFFWQKGSLLRADWETLHIRFAMHITYQTFWVFLQKTGSFCLTQCFPDMFDCTAYFSLITFNSFPTSLQHLTKDWVEGSVEMNPLTHKSCKSHGSCDKHKRYILSRAYQETAGWGGMFGEQKFWASPVSSRKLALVGGYEIFGERFVEVTGLGSSRSQIYHPKTSPCMYGCKNCL